MVRPFKGRQSHRALSHGTAMPRPPILTNVAMLSGSGYTIVRITTGGVPELFGSPAHLVGG